MMLNLQHRQSHLFRGRRGIVGGMQVARHQRRLCLQQAAHPLHGFCQRPHGAHIPHVSNVRRRIKQCIFSDTERIFQLAAYRQHLSLPVSVHHHRQRRITSGAAHHVRLPAEKVHDRIVGTDSYEPVMGQNNVAKSQKLPPGVRIVPADGSTGGIGAGHHQAIRHFCIIVVVKEQKLYGRIWKHHAHLRIARSHRRTEPPPFFPRQQQDRLLMSV